MTAQGGYGYSLKIMVSTTLTAIVGVESGTFPEQMAYIAETTGHDATSGYYTAVKTGKKRLQPFDVMIFWDKAETTHAAIKTAFDADTSVSMSVQDPDGDEIIAFSANIETIGRISEQEDAFRATVRIHPTGAPTITP